MKNVFTLMCLLAVAGFISSCSNSADTSNDAPAAENSSSERQAVTADKESATNILQVAIGSKDHTTLVAAVQAAQIEHVLQNPGPLTVFAPTNEAFAKLPAGTVDELLKPENKSKLAMILTYHAAPGTYEGENLPRIMGIGQATGHKVKIEQTADGGYTVNGAKILATVKASNGIVHVIDGVLLPPE